MKSAIANIVSTFMGFISGILVYAMFLMLFGNFISNRTDTDSNFLFIVILLFVLGGSWFISSFILINQAKSISKVFSRGFLLWAAEWLLMILVTIINALKVAITTNWDKSSDLNVGMSIIFGGVTILTTIGFCFVMSSSCMIGYAISYFLPKEMQQEKIMKECPLCTEFVKKEAIKCRFCGHSFSK